MKIGIISDIHARIQPLKQALTILKREHVSKVVCCGDLVEKGYDGDAVVRLLKRFQIPCVRGNHDEAAIDNQRWWREQLNESEVMKTLDSLRSGHNSDQSILLTDETLQYLNALPFSLNYVWGGFKVLLVHGSPKSNVTYLMPEMPDQTLAKHIGDIDADILICGHTHRPMIRDVAHVTILNPGWVGGGEQGTCATLSLPEFDFQVFSLDSG